MAHARQASRVCCCSTGIRSNLQPIASSVASQHGAARKRHKRQHVYPLVGFIQRVGSHVYFHWRWESRDSMSCWTYQTQLTQRFCVESQAPTVLDAACRGCKEASLQGRIGCRGSLAVRVPCSFHPPSSFWPRQAAHLSPQGWVDAYPRLQCLPQAPARDAARCCSLRARK